MKSLLPELISFGLGWAGKMLVMSVIGEGLIKPLARAILRRLKKEQRLLLQSWWQHHWGLHLGSRAHCQVCHAR